MFQSLACAVSLDISLSVESVQELYALSLAENLDFLDEDNANVCQYGIIATSMSTYSILQL